MSEDKRNSLIRLVERIRNESGCVFDVDGLIAMRDQVAKERVAKTHLANEELDGKPVRIPGYLLPLEFDGDKVSEFLLVPYVGACIHTPPPPPNQIVHVVADKPFATKGLFEAVVVTAKMEVVNKVSELFLVDGTDNINTSYAMNSAKVAKYEGPKK